MSSKSLGWVVIAVAVLLFLAAACDPLSKQSSVIRSNPQVFQKGFTQAEQARITQGFKADPSKYSQQYGQMVLWKMYQQNPRFAEKAAFTPEFNDKDGINPAEARALYSMYELFKDVQIPNELLQDNQSIAGQDHNLKVSWKGLGKEAKKITVKLGSAGYGSRGMSKIKSEPVPVSFEDNDLLDFNEQYGSVTVNSNLGPNDLDGIIFALNRPKDGKLLVIFHFNLIGIPLAEIYEKKKVVMEKNQFGYALPAKLIIEPGAKESIYSKYKPAQLFLADVVKELSDGFSPLIEALVWGYVDGKFKLGDDILKSYVNALSFVKPIWGDMKGPKWRDFDVVTSRLNRPELIDFYIRRNFHYRYFLAHNSRAIDAFETKGGNCTQIEEFQSYCLSQAGYDAKRLVVRSNDSGGSQGHAVTIYYVGKVFYIMDDGKIRPKGILGPFKSIKECPYTPADYNY